jgi:hypothetical protein
MAVSPVGLKTRSIYDVRSVNLQPVRIWHRSTPTVTPNAELQHCGRTRAAAGLSGHLITLPQGQWALWSCGALRAAGFPMAGVLRLSAPGCAAFADRLVQAEDQAEKLWSQAIEALEHEIGKGDADKRPLLVRSLRALKTGRPTEPLKVAGSAGRVVERLQAACELVASAWADYATAFDEAKVLTSLEIQQIKNIERLREAIVWQNRNALHTGIDAHLSAPVRDLSDITGKRRKRECLVANYWQRYCAKNDTIGFFGPIGWLRLNRNIRRMLVRPGPKLIAKRTVYFEVWSIRALANKLSGERELRLWLAPRLSLGWRCCPHAAHRETSALSS